MNTRGKLPDHFKKTGGLGPFDPLLFYQGIKFPFTLQLRPSFPGAGNSDFLSFPTSPNPMELPPCRVQNKSSSAASLMDRHPRDALGLPRDRHQALNEELFSW